MTNSKEKCKRDFVHDRVKGLVYWHPFKMLNVTEYSATKYQTSNNLKKLLVLDPSSYHHNIVF